MKLATLCYIKDQGKTLMMHRIKKKNDMHEGKWVVPGGKVENGESPEECIKREVREESGLTLRKLSMKGIITFSGSGTSEDWYVFVFVSDQFEGELIDSSEGNLKWIKDSEMLNLNLNVSDEVFLPWLSQPEFFSAKFTSNDDWTTSSHEVSFY